MILAGDVGATKILLEAGDFRSGGWQPVLARRYLIADFDDFSAVIAAFLAEWQALRPARARLTAAGIGVAGPVLGNKAKMTNRAWSLDGDALARRFGIARVRLLNDLAAAAAGIDSLPSRDLTPLQPGKADPTAARAVLGVGTGLGVAYMVPRGGGYEVVPGEGGHAGFSPASAEQAELWRAMFASHGRVEAEQVASGMGLANIYEALRRAGDCPSGAPERAEPAWITQAAFEKRDPMCLKALDLFAECLGNIAGDHALAVMARGGVFLAGGVIAKIAPSFNAQKFRESFCAKGLFSAHLMKMPVRLVTNEKVALVGAARVAQRA